MKGKANITLINMKKSKKTKPYINEQHTNTYLQNRTKKPSVKSVKVNGPEISKIILYNKTSISKDCRIQIRSYKFSQIATS